MKIIKKNKISLTIFFLFFLTIGNYALKAEAWGYYNAAGLFVDAISEVDCGQKLQGDASAKLVGVCIENAIIPSTNKNTGIYAFSANNNGVVTVFPYFATKLICDDGRTNYLDATKANTSIVVSACSILNQGDIVHTINPDPKAAGSEVSSVYHFLAPIGLGTSIDTTDIGSYFNWIFKLAIGLCAALAVIMIIIGGVQYMGDESIFGKTEAKDKILKAILGLLIAIGSWVLLNTINPALTGKGGVNVANITTIVPLYDRGISDAKKTNGESVRCTPVLSGPCSVANLTTIFGAANAVAMSKICNMESSGTNATSSTDVCKPGNAAFSFGLFQINLAANGELAGSDCVGLFDKKVSAKDVIEPRYSSGYTCNLVPGKFALYNTCKARLLNSTQNLAIAKKLFTNSKSAWVGDKKYCASAFN